MPRATKKPKTETPPPTVTMFPSEPVAIEHGLCVCFAGFGPGDRADGSFRTPWVIAELTTGTVRLRRPDDFIADGEDGDEHLQEVLYFRHDHPAWFLHSDGRSVVDRLCETPNTLAVPVSYRGGVCSVFFTKHCPPPIPRSQL